MLLVSSSIREARQKTYHGESFAEDKVEPLPMNCWISEFDKVKLRFWAKNKLKSSIESNINFSFLNLDMTTSTLHTTHLLLVFTLINIKIPKEISAFIEY